jgi:hypothetical protein
MEVPAGTPAIDMAARNPADEATYGTEREILLARGGSYRIDGVSDQPDKTFGSEYPLYVIHMSRVQ